MFESFQEWCSTEKNLENVMVLVSLTDQIKADERF